MLRATWKSLLARKLRLLMSTFAIVLGVAFVAGSLIFTDTLSRSFTALFDNSGRRRRRPAGRVARRRRGRATTVARSRLAGRPAAPRLPGAARADGNVHALGVFVVGKDRKVVGGLGPPGVRRQLQRRARRPRDQAAAAGRRRHARTAPDEVVLDDKTAEQRRLLHRRQGPHRHRHRAGRADPAAGRPRRVRRQQLAGRRDADDLRHPDRAEALPRGQDAFTTIWVTADAGVSQTSLRDEVATVLPPTSSASPATRPPTRPPARC